MASAPGGQSSGDQGIVDLPKITNKTDTRDYLARAMPHMATAWVQGGQVVLRKAAVPGYGVELGGGTKTDRLQVRAVAFAGTGPVRDESRDRDIETMWCSEFESLRTLIASSGGGIEIERALPVGATPLKQIVDTQNEDTELKRAPKTLQN